MKTIHHPITSCYTKTPTSHNIYKYTWGNKIVSSSSFFNYTCIEGLMEMVNLTQNYPNWNLIIDDPQVKLICDIHKLLEKMKSVLMTY